MTDTAAAHDLSDPATDPFAVAEAAAAVIRERTGVERHDVALVLGSGWGQTGDLIGETLATIENTDVPGFGKAAVAGHTGHDALGRHRRHRPPGPGLRHPHPLLRGARGARGRARHPHGRGARAAGPSSSPTAAAACARSGRRARRCSSPTTSTSPRPPPSRARNFVDLTDVYSPRLRAIAKEIDPTLDEGVYVQFRGPHYETPAEVRMAGVLGGDLVGMSTSLEAIAARQSGLEVLGISLVTNPAAGISTTPLNHEEVLEAGRDAAERCGRLLAAVVGRI